MNAILRLMKVSDWLKLIVLALAIIGVFGFSVFVMDYALARWVQAYLGYYFCLVATMMAALFLYRYVRRDDWILGFCGNRYLALAVIFAAVGTYLTYVHQDLTMRVFNDEPGHALVAESMAQERTVFASTNGHFEGGAFVYSDPDPVYRMYYYSFVVSLLHNLTGVRMFNLYAVNIVATFALLLVVFKLGMLFSGKPAGGFFAQALLVSTPLLGYVASSANYDTLNLFLLSAFMLACLGYVKSGGCTQLNIAISVGILLAYCRSESILYLLLLPVLFILRSWRDRRIELSLYASLSPIFLIVPFAGKILGEQLSASLSSFYTHVETGFFSSDYFIRNSIRFFDWFFAVSSGNLNSILLSVLGVASILLLPFAVVSRIRNAKDEGDPLPNYDLYLFLILGVVALHLVMLMFLYWDPTEASAIRFFLPFMLILVLSVVRVLGWLDRLMSAKVWVLGGLICASYFWAIAIPKASAGGTTHRSIPADYARRTLQWMQQHDDGRTLYAVRGPYYTLLHEFPSLSILDLNRNKDKLPDLIAEGLYDRIIVMNVFYFSPVEHRWIQPSPVMPLSESILTRPYDGWRGYIHGETTVEEVVAIKSDAGEIIPLRPGGAKAKTFENTEIFFNYIRSLHP